MNNNIRKNTVALFFLGISSGLPLLLVFGTLSVWLREAGVERATIGFLSWAGLSYGFKFVWAPAVDSIKIPFLSSRLGRRRSWILLAQIFIACALVWMSLWDPEYQQRELVLLAIGAIALGFASATQDIAIDAYRIDIAEDDQQALLAGIAIAGYRFGMLLAGAGALELSAWVGEEGVYDHSSWQFAYFCMAILMLLGMLTTLLVREPKVSQTNGTVSNNLKLVVHFVLVVAIFVFTFFVVGRLFLYFEVSNALVNFMLQALRLLFSIGIAASVGQLLCNTGLLDQKDFQQVYVEPFTDFFKRYGKLAIWLLLLICLYRTSDIVMGVMAKVFYTDMGYSKVQIGRISFAFGTVVSLIGGILGGVMALRFGIIRILLLGAIVSAASNLIFIYLALLPNPSTLALTMAIIGDNISGGLAGGVAVAFLSSLVSRRFSASQYAAFSSITLLLPKLLAGYSGQIVDATGYELFFALTAVMGIPAIFLIFKIWKPYKHLVS